MEALNILIQLVIGLVILNVWFVRARRCTPYRGGGAQTLREEFNTYGLPSWSFYAVGVLKVTSALALLAGIWLPVLVSPAALVMAILMLGAVVMHLRAGDPPIKFFPAATLLVLSLCLILF